MKTGRSSNIGEEAQASKRAVASLNKTQSLFLGQATRLSQRADEAQIMGSAPGAGPGSALGLREHRHLNEGKSSQHGSKPQRAFLNKGSNSKSQSFLIGQPIPIQRKKRSNQQQFGNINRLQGSPAHEEDVTMTQSQMSFNQDERRSLNPGHLQPPLASLLHHQETQLGQNMPHLRIAEHNLSGQDQNASPYQLDHQHSL